MHIKNKGGDMQTEPAIRRRWRAASVSRHFALFFVLAGCWLASSQSGLNGQAAPSPDPVPLLIILTRLDKGDVAGAERLMSDNLPVMKRRLEEVIAGFDQKFDELGRS